MKPFDELTRAGKARRLRGLALDVLTEQYGLDDARVQLVSIHSFNTLFRVDSPVGRFALRIGDSTRIHPAAVEDVEARWLRSLAGEGFGVAQIVPTNDGRYWTTAKAPGVPDERVCTLFTWIKGKQLRGHVDARAITNAGRLFAELHLQAAHTRIEAPAHLHARDAVYFGDTNLVASYRSTHGSLFNEATERVQVLIDGLWQSSTEMPHLLHGDYGPHNIMTWRNQLTPIDFQDLRYGFATQDLGITLTDLGRSAPHYVGLFMAGYRDIREPDELTPAVLAILAAGRSLNIMNLALLSPNSGTGETLETHAQHIVTWMHSRPRHIS